MAEFLKMNLQMFGDGGGAGAAPGAVGDGAGEAAESTTAPGTLPDGTVVDNRLAARMEEQARRRRARGEEPKQAEMKAAEPQKRTPQQAEAQPKPEQPMSLEDEWAEARKGKFREFIGRDIQAAVQERFKNQKDANETLSRIEPALKALARQRGIEEGNIDELVDDIMNDDSLFEDEAAEAGMSVEAYRTHQQLVAENERFKAQQQQEAEEQILREHFRNLAVQAEEMKKVYPDFSLEREMENQTFRRLTAPNSGLTVEAAFYAVHHKELEPQVMAYGMQRAQQQISQTLQANRMRPVEGAMQKGQPADVAIDPRKMTREERQKLIERARRGEKVTF